MRRSSFLFGLLLIFIIFFSCGEKKSESQSKTYRISREEIGKKSICPVCGMKITVSWQTPAVDYKGKIYYFCNEEEKGRFIADPENFLSEEMEKEKIFMEAEEGTGMSEEEIKALGYKVHKITKEEIDKITLCPGCQKYLAVSSETPALEKEGEILYFCSNACLETFLKRRK